MNFKYIDIEQFKDTDSYGIYDKNGEYLASIKKIRVGAWMTYCLTEVVAQDVYFSASCLDDVRKTIKELNAKANKKG